MPMLLGDFQRTPDVRGPCRDGQSETEIMTSQTAITDSGDCCDPLPMKHNLPSSIIAPSDDGHPRRASLYPPTEARRWLAWFLAFAMVVVGLNLLADGIAEESQRYR